MVKPENGGARKQNPPQRLFRPVASAPTHSTQKSEHRLETSQGAGESRETNAESRTRGHVYPRKKKNSRRPKEEVPKKIKARASAWRNKRNKNRKWRQYKDQPKR